VKEGYCRAVGALSMFGMWKYYAVEAYYLYRWKIVIIYTFSTPLLHNWHYL